MTFSEAFAQLSEIGQCRLCVEVCGYFGRTSLEWRCEFRSGHALEDESFWADTPEELLALVELAAARCARKPPDLAAVNPEAIR